MPTPITVRISEIPVSCGTSTSLMLTRASRDLNLSIQSAVVFLQMHWYGEAGQRELRTWLVDRNTILPNKRDTAAYFDTLLSGVNFQCNTILQKDTQQG